jgi:hypothetical protein
MSSEAQGIVVSFDDEDFTPRPRFLGKSTSRAEYDGLIKAIPPEDYTSDDMLPLLGAPTERSLWVFKRKMEDAFDATKNKSKATKEKRKAARQAACQAKQREWGRQSKHVQQYLGIQDQTQPGGFLGKAPIAMITGGTQYASILDPASPVLYEQDSSVVFICVDVEAFEHNHSQITEIGIATLDTAEIADISSGEGGRNWMKAIRTRHFRIRDHSHLKNKDFVQDCADKFEFGESEWIDLGDAAKTVAACFRGPFVDVSDNKCGFKEKRNIVLVGHEISSDMCYLRAIGYNPSNLSNLIETVDTAAMFRALRRELTSRSLSHLLYELDLEGRNVHNAGNDAHYTLQAMIAIAFQDSDQEGVKGDSTRDQEAANRPVEKIMDENEE